PGRFPDRCGHSRSAAVLLSSVLHFCTASCFSNSVHPDFVLSRRGAILIRVPGALSGCRRGASACAADMDVCHPDPISIAIRATTVPGCLPAKSLGPRHLWFSACSASWHSSRPCLFVLFRPFLHHRLCWRLHHLQ